MDSSNAIIPAQKVRWLILAEHARQSLGDLCPFDGTAIDQEFARLSEGNHLDDARNTIYYSSVETGLHVDVEEYREGYQSTAMAAQCPDGTWVAWTMHYSTGDHCESFDQDDDWIEGAYDVRVIREKTVVQRDFAKGPKLDGMALVRERRRQRRAPGAAA